jgi:hypothetical protein
MDLRLLASRINSTIQEGLDRPLLLSRLRQISDFILQEIQAHADYGAAEVA